MHPRFMRSLVLAFAGSNAVLLACVVHDDTNFQNSPHPTDTIPPTRPVVFDSGVVTLLDDAGGGPSGIGSGEQFTPDAAEEPDVASGLATPDSGGLGANCDVFDQTTCAAPWGCLPNPAEGTKTCQDLGTNHVLPIYSTGCSLSPSTSELTCRAGLVCVTLNGIASCTNLCHPKNPAGECLGSTMNTCVNLGATDVGYCE
jgi:hypothetical protein